MDVSKQAGAVRRWAGHLLALAILFAFLAAAEDGCAGEEEAAPETPPPATADGADATATAGDADATATAEARATVEAIAADAAATAEAEATAAIAAELEYLVGITPFLDVITEALDDFMAWADGVSTQYGLGVLFPDTAAGHLALDRLRDVVGRVESLQPPPAFQESHGLMLAAVAEWVTGMELVIAGTDQADPALVDQGTAHVVEATRLLDLAIDALERVD